MKNKRFVLNLGAGKKHHPDAVNVDHVPFTNPDVVHDLNKAPWPFQDGQFSEVRAYDVIEHLDNVVGVMEEIHRVAADRAIVKIAVPHFSCVNAFTDPTHRHFFSIGSFNYFTGESDFDFYTKKRFLRQTGKIIFKPTLANRLVQRLANRWPEVYESRWAWIFPAWFLYFELVVLKNPS